MRVEAAVDRYLSALRGRRASATRIKAYASDLRRFLTVAPEELSRIDAAVVRAFLERIVT